MHRFYIADLPSRPQRLTLKHSEAFHAIKVFRVRPGDAVTVLDGQGTHVSTQVRSVHDKVVELEVLKVERKETSQSEITLVQAVTKPASMDWIIQKATELGTRFIQPALTQRVVSKMNPRELPRKTEKWQRVAVESLKQCGGWWLPTIHPPKPFSQILQSAGDFHKQIVASLTLPASEVRGMFKEWIASLDNTSCVRVAVWIGPEGDFTADELAQLVASGATPITLGENVLRSETAAICALTLVSSELRRMQLHPNDQSFD